MADFTDHKRKDWEKLAAKELKGADPATLTWTTPEGIAVKPLYTADDLAGIEVTGGLPGLPPPAARAPPANGPGPSGNMPAFHRRGFNAFYRDNLRRGKGPQSPSTSPPPRLRSDHPAWSAMLTRPAWRSFIEDMKILFDGIPLDQMSVSMTMNGAGCVLAGFIVAGEEQG